MKLMAGRCFAVLILTVPLVLQGAVEVKIVSGPGDLPEPFSAQCRKGDIFISDGRCLALVAATRRPMRNQMNHPAPDAMGSLLALVPAGKGLVNDIQIGTPVLRFKKKMEFPVCSSIKPVAGKTPGDGLAFEALSAYEGRAGQKARISTRYVFLPGGRINIASTIANTGSTDITELGYSLYFNPNHLYNFSPYNRDKHPDLNFRVYPKKGLALGWINLGQAEAADCPLPGKLEPGGKYEVRYVLLADTRPERILDRIYGILGRTCVPLNVQFKNARGRLMEVVVQNALSSSVFFRTFLEEASSCEIPVPAGVYNVRGNFFPAVREVLAEATEDGENACILEDAACGRVKVKIRDTRGEPIPGKVTFIGLSPTPTPYFEPDNPLETGRSHERFKNSCYPGEGGTEVALPAGTYLVYGSRGPEYTMEQKTIEVLQDRTQEIAFHIDKVIETNGFISVDPHLHTQNSDSSVRVPERLRSIAAEGVDVAIATDHNFVTDYAPVLKKLGLDSWLTVVGGAEVTPLDNYVHFNTYPVVPDEKEERHGAIPPVGDGVSAMFSAARSKFPGVILQANHPRAGSLGYFNNADLDPESAAAALENIDLSFDVFEIMNGPAFYQTNDDAVRDYFHLLNRGYFYGIVGSSDSHSADGQEPGYSRVYVRYPGEKGGRLDWKSLARALKEGRAFVSNGPWVDFRVNGRHAPGDTLTERSGQIRLTVDVKSAPWISVDEVRVVVNGERKVVLPVEPRGGRRLDFSGEVCMSLKQDSFLAVEVAGNRTLYPVVQQASSSGTADDAALPYALTGPVFVDLDGNGRFDPPLKEKVRIKRPEGDTSLKAPDY